MELSKDQQAFFEYYLALPQGTTGVPNWASFRIQDIPHLLGLIYVTEVIGPREHIIRLAGAKAEELLKTGLTGINIFDLWPDREKLVNEHITQDMVTQPCAYVNRMVGTVKNSNVDSVHGLLVPFSSSGTKIDMIVIYGEYYGAQPANSQDFTKYDGNIVISHIENIAYLDIGHGVPEKGPGIAKYEEAVRQQLAGAS